MLRENRFKVAGLRYVFGAAIVVLLGWLVFSFVQHFNDQRINHGEFQAVYLVSGQIYFGKLQNSTGEYLTLKDVWLAQSNDASTASNGTTQVSTPTSTGLLKATNQVYGPEDSMAIRSSQVQLWQNMRSDSKVTKAIEAAEKK